MLMVSKINKKEYVKTGLEKRKSFTGLFSSLGSVARMLSELLVPLLKEYIKHK
jgi:hypothetical protein